MSQPVHILFADDDEDLREAIVESLSDDMMIVTAVENAAAAREKITQNHYDLYLLDVDMGEEDGRDLCKWMREQKITAPILMLTGQTGDDDTIQALDKGADDHIAKPIRAAVLRKRIEIHLKKHLKSEDATIVIGPYKANFNDRWLVHEDGATLKLTDKEAKLLKILHRAHGETVSKAELLMTIWNQRPDLNSHTLETHIYRLRQKIKRKGNEDKIVETRNGGYALVTDIQ